MSPEAVSSLLRSTLLTALELAAPFLILSLVIGVLIAFFQSMTQLQEMTLSFIPKILGVGLLLIVLFPWMVKIFQKFTHSLLIEKWDQLFSYAF